MIYEHGEHGGMILAEETEKFEKKISLSATLSNINVT
jgi:hypothetical protein